MNEKKKQRVRGEALRTSLVICALIEFHVTENTDINNDNVYFKKKIILNFKSFYKLN